MTSCEPITEGHINQTYLVKTEYEKEYILQHINSHALQYPEQMMLNIVKVAEYLRNSKSLLQIPHFYQTATGEYLFQNWRIMDKIQGITLKNSNDLKVIHSMGCAFGAFHQGLAEFPLTELADTFHDFHNTQIRFSNLWNAVRQDHFHKASQITEELQQLHDYENRACLLQKMKFPMRVLHGDMKRSNVLLNPNNFEPVAVIDLDTLMTGTILTDYGDAVRSLMGTTFDISKYQAFESGYLESAQFLF
jgi:Ser/Thr protein kinase RdoA (MazF antagonist)